LSSEYESESETSTGSALPLYTSPLPLPSPPIDSLPPHPNISQINLHEVIRQQQEQLAAMQAQIQALLAAGEEAGGTERRITGSNMGPHIEMAKPAIFNGEARKVGGFVTMCRLYLRMKMRETTVEEQVFWILSHVQGESADI